MLAFAQRELEQERTRYGYEPPSSDRRGSSALGRAGEAPRGHYRKKSWFENLGDIFD
jgi:hypothetical protein